MSDIIQLLPDAVANQIAAGEVIQRPASVVKELIENALDADADKITLNIKDAGKTLIQVIDNGKGMSETDARMAFERHATSKIRMAEDLFSIRSMGFRGEALASIAAVADVELKTKTYESDLGTHIHIKGSELISQETIATENGSIFSVKNLFFNIPARRKFLKKDSTELNHIISEFKKTALARPEISFSLYHNDTAIYKLHKEPLIQRIANVAGKSYLKQLLKIDSETSLVSITGYIGTPETAKKRNNDEYFFVNKRFMKHPYFHKALLSAYEQIIRPDLRPSFFLYFDIAPEHIDINIHPAKIQINFDDAPGIFQLVRASVRQALGKSNIGPSIDFDTEGAIDIPHLKPDSGTYQEPDIHTKESYNPFDEEKAKPSSFIFKKNAQNKLPDEWESLYENFEKEIDFKESTEEISQKHFTPVFQFKKKYLITAISSGLLIIHITRAHERIIFEDFLNKLGSEKIHTQKLTYPVEIPSDSSSLEFLHAAEDVLKSVGLDFQTDKISDKIIINGIPDFLPNANPKELIESFMVQIKDDPEFLTSETKEKLAEIIAKKKSMTFAKTLAEEELQHLVNSLLICSNPKYTHDGRVIMHKINADAVESFF